MQCHEMASRDGFVSIRTVLGPIIKEEEASKNEDSEDEQSKKRRQEMGVSEGCANP